MRFILIPIIISVAGHVARSDDGMSPLKQYAQFGEVYPGPIPRAGIDALYVSAKLQGIKTDMLKLVSSAHLDDKPATMLQLKSAAKTMPADVIAYELDPSDLHSVPRFSIVQLKDGSYAVLIRIVGENVELVQSAKHYSQVITDFVGGWTGGVLELRAQDDSSRKPVEVTFDASSFAIPNNVVSGRDISLGRIPGDVEHIRYIVLKNATSSVLKITNIQTSCGCTATKIDNKDLAESGSAKITVTFNSRGIYGYFEKHIIIDTENVSGSRVQTVVSMTGNIIGEERVVCTPAIAAIHTFAGASTRPVVVTIAREGDAPLRLMSVATSEKWLNASVLGTSAAASGEYIYRHSDLSPKVEIALNLSSDLSPGHHSARLNIDTDNVIYHHLDVAVEAYVDENVQAEPRSIFEPSLTRVGKDFQILLKSRTDTGFRITDASVFPLKLGKIVVQNVGGTSGNVLNVHLTSQSFRPGEIISGEISCQTSLAICPVIVIPIAIRVSDSDN